MVGYGADVALGVAWPLAGQRGVARFRVGKHEAFLRQVEDAGMRLNSCAKLRTFLDMSTLQTN